MFHALNIPQSAKNFNRKGVLFEKFCDVNNLPY